MIENQKPQIVEEDASEDTEKEGKIQFPVGAFIAVVVILVLMIGCIIAISLLSGAK